MQVLQVKFESGPLLSPDTILDMAINRNWDIYSFAERIYSLKIQTVLQKKFQWWTVKNFF